MKIYITGHTGGVGRRLLQRGCFPLFCDVTDVDSVARALDAAKPDVVAHLAAISDVNLCERDKDSALKVNYVGARNVAMLCHDRSIGMAFLSTDHIFDGKNGPYREDYKYTRADIFGRVQHPVNYYGLTKLTAELMAAAIPFKIVRTSYLFDAARLLAMSAGGTYPTFMRRSFMSVDHFVETLSQYLSRFHAMPDVLHISGSETVSWYEFRLAVASVLGQNKRNVIPRTRPLSRKDEEARGWAPRPRKAGLVTTLSAKLGLPQFSYLDGLKA